MSSGATPIVSTFAGGQIATPALCFKKGNSEQQIPLRRILTLIGSRPPCHLRLKSSDVSGCHAAILHRDGRLYLRDLNSRSQVFCNGEAVRDRLLTGGEVIRIGPYEFTVRVASVAISRAWVARRPPAGEIWVEGGPDEPAIVDEPVFLIGRREGADLTIGSDRVSAAHAVIVSSGTSWSIVDLGSRTGTLVNGRRVAMERLADPSVIEIGGTKLTFRLAGRAAEAGRQGLEPPRRPADATRRQDVAEAPNKPTDAGDNAADSAPSLHLPTTDEPSTSVPPDVSHRIDHATAVWPADDEGKPNKAQFDAARPAGRKRVTDLADNAPTAAAVSHATARQAAMGETSTGSKVGDLSTIEDPSSDGATARIGADHGADETSLAESRFPPPPARPPSGGIDAEPQAIANPPSAMPSTATGELSVEPRFGEGPAGPIAPQLKDWGPFAFAVGNPELIEVWGASQRDRDSREPLPAAVRASTRHRSVLRWGLLAGGGLVVVLLVLAALGHWLGWWTAII